MQTKIKSNCIVIEIVAKRIIFNYRLKLELQVPVLYLNISKNLESLLLITITHDHWKQQKQTLDCKLVKLAIVPHQICKSYSSMHSDLSFVIM